MIFQDLSGQKFGRLLVLSFVGRTNTGISKFLCRCDCGKEKVVSSGNMKSGSVYSCGCGSICKSQIV